MARLSINRVLLILAAFKMLQFIQGLGICMGKIILPRKAGGKEVGPDLGEPWPTSSSARMRAAAWTKVIGKAEAPARSIALSSQNNRNSYYVHIKICKLIYFEHIYIFNRY